MVQVSAYEWYSRGMALLESGDTHQSALALERAKREEPDAASIREGLGRAYLAMRRFSDAAEEFRRVTEIAPTNHYAHYCLSRALRGIGDTRGARRHVKLARCLGSTLV